MWGGENGSSLREDSNSCSHLSLEPDSEVVVMEMCSVFILVLGYGHCLVTAAWKERSTCMENEGRVLLSDLRSHCRQTEVEDVWGAGAIRRGHPHYLTTSSEDATHTLPAVSPPDSCPLNDSTPWEGGTRAPTAYPGSSAMLIKNSSAVGGNKGS